MGGGVEDDSGSSSGGIPVWVWILVGVVVLLIIAGVVFMVMRSKGEEA